MTYRLYILVPFVLLFIVNASNDCRLPPTTEDDLDEADSLRSVLPLSTEEKEDLIDTCNRYRYM